MARYFAVGCATILPGFILIGFVAADALNSSPFVLPVCGVALLILGYLAVRPFHRRFTRHQLLLAHYDVHLGPYGTVRTR